MKKKNIIKKIWLPILSIGILSSAIITTAVACKTNDKKSTQHYKIFPTYASQADILISLGIGVDYYPHQAYRHNEYDYMNVKSNNFANYILDKNDFQNQFKNKLSILLKDDTIRARTWWGIRFDSITNDATSEEYWTSKSGDLLFYDRYLLDGSHEDTGGNRHIINQPKVNQVIESDFKTSRDIYTNFSLQNANDLLKNNKSNILSSSLINAIQTNENNQYTSDVIYNYAYTFKKDLSLIEKLKDRTSILDWVINKDGLNTQPVFYASNDRQKDQKIASLYEKFIISKQLKQKGFTHLNYNNPNVSTNSYTSSSLHHHPVYEQTSAISGSAMYSGAMRDAILNWYKIASDLEEYSKTSSFNTNYENDDRKQPIQNAVSNIDEIARNLKQRLKDTRAFLKSINVVDQNYDPDTNNFDNTNSKTVAIIMNAPSNQGVSTIQSQSKYGFMYFDLGLKAPFPDTDLDNIKSSINEDSDSIDLASNPVFNMDDNGWWWNLGENRFSDVNTNMFKNQFDTTFLLISGNDILNNDKRTRLEFMNKNNGLNGIVNEDFNLWNDGIKSPIGYNMLLDRVIAQFKNQYTNTLDEKQTQLYLKANNWGSYWKTKFTNNEK